MFYALIGLNPNPNPNPNRNDDDNNNNRLTAFVPGLPG